VAVGSRCADWQKNIARSPNLVDSLGFTQSVVSDERKPDRFVAERHVVYNVSDVGCGVADVYIIHQYT